jgi:hypothetical protein
MMAFYYISVFSIIPLGIAYGLLALVYWGLVRVTRGARARRAILSGIAVAFLILPVSEELWIAWNFAQACQQSGTFINKTVQVEGFYDDTRSTHAGKPTSQAVQSFEKSGYRFLEMRGDGKVVRIEKVNGEWKPTLLDRPTARYQFKYTDPMNGTPWGHKIVRTGSVVIDSQTNDEIARYTSYGRGAPWFFIWLDKPGFVCDSPGRWPYTGSSRLVYEKAFTPCRGGGDSLCGARSEAVSMNQKGV